MASSKILHAQRATSNYIFVNPEAEIDQLESSFEFDEADVWNDNNNNSSSSAVSQFDQVKKKLPSSRLSKKGGGGSRSMVVTATTPVTCVSSLPVNVPDWSKIYRVHHRHRVNNVDDQDGDENDILDDGDDDHNDDDDRIPPHEYLARRRGASFSVHEGIGRTLKGRDLRQVRNAIWKKVGFED